MSMHNLHLLIPVANEQASMQAAVRHLNPSQERMLAHIDGQISLAALAVMLEKTDQQIIADTKTLILHKLIRLCRLPSDASQILPTLVQQDADSTTDIKIAWTQQQAQERRAWSTTERDLLTVAYKQQQRNTPPSARREPYNHTPSPQWLDGQESERSLERRGVFGILSDLQQELGATIETPTIPGPLSQATPTPRSTAILDSLDDLDAWDAETSTSPSQSYNGLPTGSVVPLDDEPAQGPHDSSEYQALSYYDLPSSPDESLKPSGKSYPGLPQVNLQAMRNPSPVQEQDVPLSPTLHEIPPVPAAYRRPHLTPQANPTLRNESDSLLELALLGEAPPESWKPLQRQSMSPASKPVPPSPLPSLLHTDKKKH
ncbi:MAG: hypothetical protein EP343_26545 [Deltaproteobacteria bacterium]|nr:MAG: hypothetical protein EP343_26545 [Deltaproteobacteria bacterium]